MYRELTSEIESVVEVIMEGEGVATDTHGQVAPHVKTIVRDDSGASCVR